MEAGRRSPKRPGEGARPAPWLDRPALLDRLDAAIERPFTIISAPVGYGKSALLAEWREQRCRLPVHEAAPEAPTAAAALQALLTAMAAASGRDLPPVPAHAADSGARLDARARRELAAALAGTPAAVVVVDEHHGREPVAGYADVAHALAEARACELRVIAATRARPAPDLAPLRVRGIVDQLTEVELRVADADMVTFLSTILDRAVTGDRVAGLARELRGWIGGAALLALSRPTAAGAEDPEGWIAAGFDAIADLVWSQVFAPLPAELRDFLLEASLLDELDPRVCDHAFERTDSRRRLTELRTAGAFLDPGPASPRGFVPNPMLRLAVDRHDATVTVAREERILRRAADWYRGHNLPLAAARCLSRLGDWDQVGEVVQLGLRDLLASGNLGELTALLDRMPLDVARRHASWVLGHAVLELMSGHPDRATEIVATAERWMTPAGRMAGNLVRTATYAWVPDPRPCLGAADAALALLDEIGDDYRYDDTFTVSTTANYRAQAHAVALPAGAYAGTWAEVEPHLTDVDPSVLASLPVVSAVEVLARRAAYLALSGRVDAAAREAGSAIARVPDGDVLSDTAAAEAHLALGEAARRGGRYEDAAAPLEAAGERAARNHRTTLLSLVLATRAHLAVDRGQPAAALALLDDDDRAQVRVPYTVAGLLASARARAHLATGDDEAGRAALRAAPPTPEVCSTLVALALTSGDRRLADLTMEGWADTATVAGQIRHDLCAAAILCDRARTRDAGRSFEATLRAAAKWGLVQPFDELAPHLHPLLARARARSWNRAVTGLLVRVREAGEVAAPRLTGRELSVLHQLGRGLTLRAIAGELHVSVNTVKSHVQAIYRKLGARSRAEALEFWRAGGPGEGS